jgi:hypothetical protein
VQPGLFADEPKIRRSGDPVDATGWWHDYCYDIDHPPLDDPSLAGQIAMIVDEPHWDGTLCVLETFMPGHRWDDSIELHGRWIVWVTPDEYTNSEYRKRISKSTTIDRWNCENGTKTSIDASQLQLV